jgi:prepilin-type N-terminal cleavage/methylation domain-containing protein
MRCISRKKGMTLVEVVISLAIIAVVLTGIMTMFSSGYINIIMTGKRNKAAEEARKVMEIITEKSPPSLDDFDIDDVRQIIHDTGTTYTIDVPEFNKDYILVTGGSSINMCKITIKVYYDNGEKYVTLTSLINR